MKFGIYLTKGREVDKSIIKYPLILTRISKNRDTNKLIKQAENTDIKDFIEKENIYSTLFCIDQYNIDRYHIIFYKFSLK